METRTLRSATSPGEDYPRIIIFFIEIFEPRIVIIYSDPDTNSPEYALNINDFDVAPDSDEI